MPRYRIDWTGYASHREPAFVEADGILRDGAHWVLYRPDAVVAVYRAIEVSRIEEIQETSA